MSNIKTGDILNFGYTGAVQSVTLPKGTYKLECWGAQGGNCYWSSMERPGSLGGYSSGILKITSKTNLFCYVGGAGERWTTVSMGGGGFNGGGHAYSYTSSNPSGAGGGGSDIRIGTDSLYSRVIVAGGGGGAGYDNSGNYGYGGGTVGGTQTVNGTSERRANGGSQTNGGINYKSGYTTSGAFGIGGNGTQQWTSGGGGGWYGGAGCYCDYAGGGSGYVYTSSTASNYPSGCLLNSSYYLSDAKTIAGNTSFTSPTGSSETGHSGNGYVRITVIECMASLYVNINNSMKKATAFYFKLNNNKMYGVGSANSNSTVMNFDYTGSVQTVTLTPGKYKLECWGAQGGDGTNYSSTGLPYTGGKGGYSSGILNIIDSGTLYIVCGSAGSTVANISNTYNGGGGSGNTNYQAGSGGGATHIGLKEGLLTTFSSDYASKLLLVAGGGGGGGNCSIGGAGGGISGVQPKTSTQYQSRTSGIAGTQTSGYLFGQGQGGNGENYAGGGGGGFYGGGQGDNSTGGGGGSGYINTSLLTNCTTTAGDQSFLSPTGSSETGHSGNGHVKITPLINTNITYLTSNDDIMDFNYTGSTQSKTLKPGTYTIECWGGQGGTYGSCIGGYGGYSKGTITLTKVTTVYISVGGAGSSSSTAAGFNGGGTGISSGRGGGGATDVRIGQNSLYSRVIVAGGGGGAGVTSANANPCGCGGGEYGGDGYYNNTTGSYTTGQNRSGGSASQTAGGITWNTGAQATFGQGGKASGYSCGGGGGGWYGGGGAYDSDSDSDGRWGGGGSGYVYTSSTAKNYPNGCLLNSTYYLTNAQTIAGNTSFTSPTGSAETGHTGNGFCRITNLNPTQYGLYVKTNSGWKHIDL